MLYKNDNKRIKIIGYLVFVSSIALCTININLLITFLLCCCISLLLILSVLQNKYSFIEIIFYMVFPLLLLYQIYIPIINTIDIPLAYIYLLFIFIISIFNYYLFIWINSQKVIHFYIIYLFALSISLIYSSDILSGFRIIFFQTTGLFSIIFGYLIRQKQKDIFKIYRYIVIFGIPLAVFNIIFFLFPNIEIAYLKTGIAKILVEPGDIEGIFSIRKNNILDPLKSGTIFTDTNEAAIFFQIIFWISITLYLTKKKKSYIFFSLIYFMALLTTYSRGGIIAFFLTLMFVLILTIRKYKGRNSIKKLIFPTAIILIPIGYFIATSELYLQMLERLQLSVITSDPRFSLWYIAFDLLKRNPILGLGFGGWEQSLPKYLSFYNQLNEGFPPHNIFLQVWIWSGILGLIAFIALILYILVKSLSLYNRGDLSQLCLIAASTVVIIQGSVQNYFFVDYRISGLFFFIAGINLFIRSNKNEGKNNK